MDATGTLAFVSSPPDARDVEVRVNFGIFSGREATQAEVDRLASSLSERLERLAISAVRRHELDTGNEAVVHQVVIEANPNDVRGALSAGELAERVRATAEAWAEDCIAERRVDPL